MRIPEIIIIKELILGNQIKVNMKKKVIFNVLCWSALVSTK